MPLHIDHLRFAEQLWRTKNFCQQQIEKGNANNAEVLRSCNPLIKRRPLFLFEYMKMALQVRPGVLGCITARWTIDPAGSGNEEIIDLLFDYQQQCKARSATQTQEPFAGRILVTEVDSTVLDGASEACSLGFIDVYDLPPVDTWFYMLSVSKTGRLFFSWIPEPYMSHVQHGIDVNCVDCFDWFSERYPEDFALLSTKVLL